MKNLYNEKAHYSGRLLSCHWMTNESSKNMIYISIYLFFLKIVTLEVSMFFLYYSYVPKFRPNTARELSFKQNQVFY